MSLTTTRPHTASSAAPMGVLNVMYCTGLLFGAGIVPLGAVIQLSALAETASMLWRASKIGSLPPGSACCFVSHSFIATAFGNAVEMSPFTAVVVGFAGTAGGVRSLKPEPSTGGHEATPLTVASVDFENH